MQMHQPFLNKSHLYEGKLKVILLLQVSSHDFKHNYYILSELNNTARAAQIKTNHLSFDT